MALQQGSAEWLAARRNLITSTDIPVLLGVSPYKSEATLAREKLEGTDTEQTLPMRVGLALEPVIADEYERQTGHKLRRFHGLVTHPTIEWAGASPDWRRQGERALVEGKYSTARRWDGGQVPDDVEAQVRWAIGVTGYPTAQVARLDGRELHISDPIEHDPQVWDNLVAIAADFRRRLAEGGPFAEDAASIKARYPSDDGSELQADAALEEAVIELLRLRALRADTVAAEERIETAIKARMGPATRLSGAGWSISWKKAKDTALTDWRLLADGLLRQLPTDQREALIGLHSTVREGARYFRVTAKGERE